MLFSKIETEASASSRASLRLPVAVASEIVSYPCSCSILMYLFWTDMIWKNINQDRIIKSFFGTSIAISNNKEKLKEVKK